MLLSNLSDLISLNYFIFILITAFAQMTSTSFNIKPPERHFSARPTNLTRQGNPIPTKNNADFIGEYSINFTIKQNNKFESIFNSLSSKMLKNQVKSERKRFKPLSALEIGDIKLKFEQEGHKRKERSLKTILFSHRDDEEIKQKRRPSTRYRPNTAHRVSKSPSHNVENQEKLHLSREKKPENADQKILLQSTNFTVRSYSWQTKNQAQPLQKSQLHQRKNSMRHSSLRTSKKGQTRQSNLLNRQDPQLATIKLAQEPQIEIRLSLKSMSRSEQGEKQSPERTTMEKWIMEENKRLREVSRQDLRMKTEMGQKDICTEKTRRQVLAGTSYKQNRMILKFDKRLLKNITQINDPCLKVSKIHTISSRLKTQITLH